jgi:putative transposase
MGNLLHVKVHAANIHDTIAGGIVVEAALAKYPTIVAVSADEGYRGTTEEYLKEISNVVLEISKKIKNTWVILTKRWIVERTFSWINNYRRLAKDVEILTETAENFIRIAMIKRTLNALSKL